MSAPTTPVPDAARSPRVEPEAAQELLALAARELRRAVGELGHVALPHSLLFLPGRLEWACQFGVDALAVRLARQSAWEGRRCDLAEAFGRLNPAFGPVHHGAWPAPVDLGGGDRGRQQRAQRRELELCMGERFARMLPPFEPAEGGAAA